MLHLVLSYKRSTFLCVLWIWAPKGASKLLCSLPMKAEKDWLLTCLIPLPHTHQPCLLWHCWYRVLGTKWRHSWSCFHDFQNRMKTHSVQILHSIPVDRVLDVSSLWSPFNPTSLTGPTLSALSPPSLFSQRPPVILCHSEALKTTPKIFYTKNDYLLWHRQHNVVYVIINKRSFESFMCLDLILEY